MLAKFMTGTLLLVGAVLGGGIIAIPIVSAQYGFLPSVLIICTAWLIMTKTGLDILELSLKCPEKYNSYFSIIGKFLGTKTQILTVFLFLWLLYFSLASYISGCASILSINLSNILAGLSYAKTNLIFVLIFASIITISAKAVIRINTLIVIAKLSLLVLTVAFILYNPSENPTTSYSYNFLNIKGLALIMVVINAFGYQFIIPSLVNYYGKHNQVIFKYMIISSTTLVMLLYILWLYTIYKIIPANGEHGLASIQESPNQLIAFSNSLQFYLHSSIAANFLSIFTSIALFGSFFCVSLGVFDFFLDMFKLNNRILISIITFSPPLIISLTSENIYIFALSIAGYIAIILEIALPLCAKYRRFGV